jgi:hypothetical protein
MDWGSAYRLQFYDIWDVKWTAIFHLEGYTGDLTDLQGSEEAIVFDFENDSDDPFAPLKPSQVTFNVINKEDFSLSTLFEVGDMELWVEVFQGNDYSSDSAEPYWCGWVDPYQYEQPYDVRPNVVSITAVDGLTLLDDILFADQDSVDDTEYYTGRSKETKIILDILGKIGYSEFKEFDNIFEERMIDSVNDSPMEQVLIDTDFGKEKYCSDVLTNILSKKKACIRQRDGVFCIYRPKSIITANTIYGRYFTGETTKSSVSYNPNQYIRRYGYDTNLKQVPGGVESIVRPAKKITLFQDYGDKESWIKYHKFESKDYDSVTNTWRGWNGTAYILTDKVPEEDDGVLIYAQSSLRAVNINQTFGTYIKTTTNAVTFSFEYYIYSWYGHTISGVTLYLKIKAVNSNHWLKRKDFGEVEWTTSDSYLDILPVDRGGDIANGRTPWHTFSWTVDGIPVTDAFIIYVYSAYSASTNDFAFAFKDFIFSSTNDTIVTKKREVHGPLPGLTRWVLGLSKYIVKYVEKKDVVEAEHIVFNDIEGSEIEQQEVLGDIVDSGLDNVLEQFSGCLGLVGAQYHSQVISLIGTPGGRAIISCNGGSFSCNFDTDSETTAAAIVGSPAIVNMFASVEVDITDSGSGGLIFTHQRKGVTFSPEAAITESIALFTGSVTTLSEPWDETAPLHTQSWYIRNEDSSEAAADELLDLMAAEVAKQYSRATHFINMLIQELSGESTLNLIGNLQDTESFGKVGTNLMTDPDGIAQAYDTFTIDGIKVTSAITVGYSYAMSNIFSVLEGEIIQVNINLTLNSGQTPSITIADGLTYQSETVQLINGINKISLKINSSSVNATLMFTNQQAANWSTGDIEVYHTGVRKYVINRGTFEVRSRRWNLDLQEMVVE